MNQDVKPAIQAVCEEATTRETLEQALKESEQRFRDFAETASDWFWETDAEHRFTSISGESVQYIDYWNDIRVGKTRFDARIPEDTDDAKWEAHRAELDARRAFKNFQYPTRGPDGAINHVRISGKPVWSEKADFLGYRGTASDITDVVEADARARSAREQLAVAIEGLAETVLLFDAEDRLVICNQSWREFNRAVAEQSQPGATFEDILRAELHVGLIPEARGQEEAWLRERLERHRTPKGPFEMAHHEGRWLLVNEHRLPDGGFITVATDISERKRTEDALRDSERRLRDIIDSSPASVVLKDRDGRFEIVNQTFLRRYDLTEPQVIGRTSFEIHPKNIADYHVVQDRIIMESGTITRNDVTVTFADGHKHDLAVTRFPIFDSHGQISGIGSISLDVTEQKKAEDSLRQAQKMEAVGQLTGGVAHDFNNLLQSVGLNAEMLRERVGEDEDSKHLTEAIERAVSRGSSLTKRLLAFSRQQILLPVAADVTGLIGGLHEMLQRTLGETMDLRVESAPDPWPATIDSHQFENALVNLAINARDAMATGGTLTIETANVTLDETYAAQHGFDVAPGDYVLVSVSDSGAGMSPEVLDKAFEPFFTTKEAGQGSGLGLSMVYGFVKQSKGHLTIYSEIDHGTTVKLYMPRSQEAPAETDATDDTREAVRGSERILIVEDDENIREVVTTILRNHGYEIVEAGNGEEAIEQVKEGKAFDLLFTDVVLPGGMNGVEIAKEARKLQPNLKVLYTTGYAENAVVHNGHLDSGVSLIDKPYRRAELLERVRAMLDSKSILLIDDDEDLRVSLQKGLERSGHGVTTASGGLEGLELIKSQRFDVIVTDVVMEEGEGVETLGWIEKVSPTTPVIGISGYPEFLRNLRKLGAAATLNKPFKIEALFEIIGEVTRAKDDAK